MRDLIRIVEGFTPILYHGSRKRFAVGTVLKPQRRGYVAGTGMDRIERRAHDRTEAILERYRPADAIPRREAVFMCDNIPDIDRAGGYDDYVYRVEPIGPVTRCNLFWYGMLLDVSDHEIDEGVAKTRALNYWTAAPGDRITIEILARAATVVEMVDTNR